MDVWLAACDAVVLPYRAISGSGIAARAIAAARPMAAAARRRAQGRGRAGRDGRAVPAGRRGGARRGRRDGPGARRRRLRARARRAAARFSWPRYAEALLEFLSDRSPNVPRPAVS